jgi:hypothetical protein
MYYLYRHIRLDKNEPFYIGIGTIAENKITFKTKYSRAFLKSRRSIFWKNIVSKVNYETEIVIESENHEFIKQKEIEFIELYGRKDIGKGILVNHTNGGEGTINWKPTNQNKINHKNAMAKVNYDRFSIKIYQYGLDGNFIKEWQSISAAALSIKISKSTLGKVIKDNTNGNYCQGFYWSLEKKKKTEIKPFNKGKTIRKIIMLDISSLKEIKTFNKINDVFFIF